MVDAHAHNIDLSGDGDSKQLELKMLEYGEVDVVGLSYAYYPLKQITLKETVKEDFITLKNELKSGNYNVGIASGSEEIFRIVKSGKVAIFICLNKCRHFKFELTFLNSVI